MKLAMNFDKNIISSKVMEFLEINLNQEEDKKNFARLLKGNKLLYKEANSFIETLLKALTIVDGKDDIPFIPRKAQDETSAITEGEDISDDETLSQNMKSSKNLEQKKTAPNLHTKEEKEKVIEKRSCRFFKRGTCKFDSECKFEHSKENDPPKQIGKEKEKTGTICKFYKNGNCKFTPNCKFAHPVLCRIYRQNGLKKFNTKGCEEDCKFFHPNGCRDSLTSKTCSRKDCRFFHINGTKTVEPKWQQNKNQTQCNNQGGCETKNRFEVLQSQCQQNCCPQQSQPYSNPSQACGTSTQSQSPNQVFQQDQSKIDQKIEALSKQMEEIHRWMRNQSSSQNQQSNSTNWRT